MEQERHATPRWPSIAFVDLYHSHHPAVLSTISGRVSDPHEAEDLAARVFELAWTRLSAGESVSLPWLFKTARNVVGSEYQRRTRARKTHLRLVSDAHANHSHEIEARDEELLRALRRLTEIDYWIIVLTYWHDQSTQTIALILKTTEDAVKMRRSRAKNRLRAELSSSRRPEAVRR